MELQLEQLEHQANAIKALRYVLDRAPIRRSIENESNPTIDIASSALHHAIREVQEGRVAGLNAIQQQWRTRFDDGVLGLDIRMETGTGKTYVYTRAMYELHQRYGFTKFIVLVPSVPIKEGAKSFITSDAARAHFADMYGTSTQLKLHTLEPQQRKRGRNHFPPAIRAFVQSSTFNAANVHALLMTDRMLLSEKTMGTTYDQMVLGSNSVPYEALSATRPVVIVDEPHRFRRENAAYRRLIARVQPQAIIRFGATFPRLSGQATIDYNNLLYDLGPVEAFNDLLVKGVAVQYPEAPGEHSTRLKLLRVSRSRPKLATFRDEDSKKTIDIPLGGSLSEVDGDFGGINVTHIGKTTVPEIPTGATLSNGQVLAVGDTIASAIYGETYQTRMLKLAIDNHIEIEYENFMRTRRLKTLSLFFIDSISSYRGEQGHGHLRSAFEKLLQEAIERKIEQLGPRLTGRQLEYRDFLRASLDDLHATSGGYFAEDNYASEDSIKEEVDHILRDKQQLLSFKNLDGGWFTRRFIFSKWTLREGWDNPNVFQIVKLRSSGSEISKLQEVGRGLRLPVDDNGNRVCGEQFYLTYLIDHAESNFAKQLVSEVNRDVPSQTSSVEALLAKVAKQLEVTEKQLFDDLYSQGLINLRMQVIEGKYPELLDRYPEFNQGVGTDKIVETTGKLPAVKIRKRQFQAIRPLWDRINQGYFLHIDQFSDSELIARLNKALIVGTPSDIYRTDKRRILEQKTIRAGHSISLKLKTKDHYDSIELIPYGNWLESAFNQTHVPIRLIHASLIERSKQRKLPSDFFNTTTLARFVRNVRSELRALYRSRYSYLALSCSTGENRLVDANGNVKDSVPRGSIGRLESKHQAVPKNYIYESFVFDSPLEGKTIPMQEA